MSGHQEIPSIEELSSGVIDCAPFLQAYIDCCSRPAGPEGHPSSFEEYINRIRNSPIAEPVGASCDGEVRGSSNDD